MDGLKYVGAGIAVVTGLGTGIGEGFIGAHAVDGMARNPEMTSKIRTMLFLADAIDESSAIYGLIIAILCLVL